MENPDKSLRKVMKNAVNIFKETTYEKIKEEGRKESEVIYEERKKDNLPPGDRGSKDRLGTNKPKVEDEDNIPQTLGDYIGERRKISDVKRGKLRR